MAVALGGRRTRVAGVRRLTGGVDASTHAVCLEPGGWVVLKRSSTTNPASLAGEFDRLLVAERTPIPTPTPLALDTEGEWFDRPALVMSRLPGHGLVHPEPGRWISELAEGWRRCTARG